VRPVPSIVQTQRSAVTCLRKLDCLFVMSWAASSSNCSINSFALLREPGGLPSGFPLCPFLNVILLPGAPLLVLCSDNGASNEALQFPKIGNVKPGSGLVGWFTSRGRTRHSETAAISLAEGVGAGSGAARRRAPTGDRFGEDHQRKATGLKTRGAGSGLC
jgi:hypothetical protein